MLDFLTAPKLPRVALSISETHLAMIELRARGRTLEPRHAAVEALPDGLVRASFTELNISSESAFMDCLTRTAERAGLGRVRKLIVALPENSARSFIATLDHEPASRSELQQMLEWKAERNLGCKAADLRFVHRPLTGLAGRTNFLVSAAQQRVLAQYEQAFDELGWQTGLIMPQHLGEAQWLIRSSLTEDQALVSVNSQGFTVVIVRGPEPILVREVFCAPNEREDEFYRLMIYYRDRLLPAGAAGAVSRLLVIGSREEQESFRRTLEAALEKNAQTLNSDSLGIKLDGNAPFNRLAAAAGMATLGC